MQGLGCGCTACTQGDKASASQPNAAFLPHPSFALLRFASLLLFWEKCNRMNFGLERKQREVLHFKLWVSKLPRIGVCFFFFFFSPWEMGSFAMEMGLFHFI